MMKSPPKKMPVTPGGKLADVACVALVILYIIGVIGVFAQTVWLSVPGSEVRVMAVLGCTVMVPVAIFTPPQGPVTITT